MNQIEGYDVYYNGKKIDMIHVDDEEDALNIAQCRIVLKVKRCQ